MQRLLEAAAAGVPAAAAESEPDEREAADA
jgi:hypothetical protein